MSGAKKNADLRANLDKSKQKGTGCITTSSAEQSFTKFEPKL